MDENNGKLITDGIDGGLDLEAQSALVDTALTGNPEYLLQAIADKGEELKAALARSGGPIAATIKQIQNEYQAMLEIRMTLLQSKAIETLHDVMDGRHQEGAAPMVAAANSVLSRGLFPMRSRQESFSLQVTRGEKLPAFEDISQGAETDEERLALADKVTSLLAELDSMKKGRSNDGKA